MRVKKVLMALFGGAAVVVFGGVAPGCGPSTGGYCNKRCDCLGCSETERTDCVDSVDDAKHSSATAGCEKEFNAYFSCINSETTCVDGKVDADGCEAEADALKKCGGPAIISGNACQALADTILAKYDACGVDIEVGEPGEEATCTDAQAKQAECYTPCYANLDCIVLKDPTNPDAEAASKSFTDCLAVCAN